MTESLDRTLAADHFALANKLVAEGQKRVDAQLALVAKLERDGHHTSQAKALLSQFEETLALQIATRDQIREDLRPGGEHDFR